MGENSAHSGEAPSGRDSASEAEPERQRCRPPRRQGQGKPLQYFRDSGPHQEKEEASVALRECPERGDRPSREEEEAAVTHHRDVAQGGSRSLEVRGGGAHDSGVRGGGRKAGRQNDRAHGSAYGPVDPAGAW